VAKGEAVILILATARPEFRQPWGAQAHHTVISLAPLGEAQVQRMIAELLFQRTLSAEVMRRVSERARGMPLFVEEVTRLILERGERRYFGGRPQTSRFLSARRVVPHAKTAGLGA
jgi:predicted ATPase